PLFQLEDTDAYSAPGEFERVASSAALNYRTDYTYGSYGLSHVQYPNGRHMFIAYIPDPAGTGIFQWTFKDVVLTSGQPFQTFSPVEITRYETPPPRIVV